MRADSKGSWPGCSNTVGSAQLARAVQIPRFYTSSMCDIGFHRLVVLIFTNIDSCNFVILSYAQGVEHEVSALGSSSWAKVDAGGNSMISRCGLDGRGTPKGVPEGGVVVIPSSKFAGNALNRRGYRRLSSRSDVTDGCCAEPIYVGIWVGV